MQSSDVKSQARLQLHQCNNRKLIVIQYFIKSHLNNLKQPCL